MSLLAKGFKPGAQIVLKFLQFPSIQHNSSSLPWLDLYDLHIFEDCRKVILYNVPPLGFVCCFFLIRLVSYIFRRSITGIMPFLLQVMPSSGCGLSPMRLTLFTWGRLPGFFTLKLPIYTLIKGPQRWNIKWIAT